MPITTPLDALEVYGEDPEHFIHVLDHLFTPAIEQAGFKLIKPIMSGADLIQAEITRRLETADLVLCDVTRHNPNVFFELGVRTSLDRPVALVRDTQTEKLPFDTSIVNTHTYDPSLLPWTLQREIEALSEHITESAERSQGKNPLWHHFGLTQRANPESIEGDPVQAKLDLIISTMESIQQERAEAVTRIGIRGELRPRAAVPQKSASRRQSLDAISKKARQKGVAVNELGYIEDGIVGMAVDNMSADLAQELEDLARSFGVQLVIEVGREISLSNSTPVRRKLPPAVDKRLAGESGI